MIHVADRFSGLVSAYYLGSMHYSKKLILCGSSFSADHQTRVGLINSAIGL